MELHYKTRLLLGADAGVQVNRAGAAVDLLHAGSAVAAGGVGSAVKLLTASTRAEDVALVGEGVSPLTGMGVSMVQETLSSLYLPAQLIVDIVGLSGRRVTEEEGAGQGSGLGNLDSLFYRALVMISCGRRANVQSQ